MMGFDLVWPGDRVSLRATTPTRPRPSVGLSSTAGVGCVISRTIPEGKK